MEINSSLFGINLDTAFQTPKIASGLITEEDSLLQQVGESQGAFESIFNSAVNLINTTNDYSNAAEEEEIKFAFSSYIKNFPKRPPTACHRLSVLATCLKLRAFALFVRDGWSTRLQICYNTATH